MMTADEALAITESAGFSDTAKAILAAEVRRLRDEVNGLTGSLDRAEKALKEEQEQEPVAYMIHEYQGTGEKRLQFQPHIPSIRDDVTGPVVTALYARPVPAAPAVAVPEEWREVLRECADDLAIELDQRYGDSRKYPSEQRKYEAEMQPVYRARALLQSTGDKK